MRLTPYCWPFWQSSRWHFLAKLFVTCVNSSLSLVSSCCSKDILTSYLISITALLHGLGYPVLQWGEVFINMESRIWFSGHPTSCSCEDFCKAPKFDCQHWKYVHPVHFREVTGTSTSQNTLHSLTSLVFEASKQKVVTTFTREAGTASRILPILWKIVTRLKGDPTSGHGNDGTIHQVKKRKYNKHPRQLSNHWMAQ